MKAKLMCAVITLFLSLLPCFAMAEETQKIDPFMNNEMTENFPDMDLLKDEEKIKEQEPFSNQNFEFSVMYHYFDYKEDLPAPYKSTEKGWLPGIYLGWNYNKKNAVYSKIFFEFSYGSVEFDGTTQSGTSITFSDDNHQFLFRAEWNIGYNFAVTNTISLKPYAGYGYRYWSRGEANETATYISYNEKYRWHYIPVGVMADFNMGDKLVIEPNAGLRLMFYGKMKAFLSKIDPGYNDPEFTLGNKIGWYAEIPLRYKFSPFWSVVVKPWYEYSEIGKSDMAPITYYGITYAYAYEPASRTHQYGLNIGMVFSY